MTNHDALNEQKRIGKFIAELREQRGITQAQLAKLIRTSQSAIARMERGQQNFTTEMLGKISRAVGRNIVSLGTNGPNVAIEGGHKLSGTVITNSSKNSSVALLCASLLNDQPTIIRKLARIEEVMRVIEVLASIGVRIRWINQEDVEITVPPKLNLAGLDTEAAIKTRSIILTIGPLLHRLQSFRLPHPGGCDLGKRTVRSHLYALEEMGVNIETTDNYYNISYRKLKPAHIVMYESGDTATENAIMTAALIPGTTTIKLASANYSIQDVCLFLQALGVRIDGIGTTTLTIHGLDKLSQPIIFQPVEDPIESMFFISAALVTKSKITVKSCPIEFLELELLKLRKMGAKLTISKPYTSTNGFTQLVDITTHPSKLVALDEKIYARPFPGLNMDNLPFFTAIATQASGTTFIHDWVYETRSIYSMEINKLGANIMLADPHRLYITGGRTLKAAEIICPPVLRVGALILICMLAAEGTSILRNVYTINRGYEDLFARLNQLGANISVSTVF